MYTVYILLCAGGTYYVGIARDVERRFREHKDGTGARYTRANPPIRIVYRQRMRTRGAALKREYALKQLTRKQKDELIRRYRLSLARSAE
jgi:putative endonuclease